MFVCERGRRLFELGRCEMIARRSSGGSVVRWSLVLASGGEVGRGDGGGVVREVLVGEGELEVDDAGEFGAVESMIYFT
tara:strand:+ start:240 stop:476 length:237 start_codon:yes stop_codon:yes gene_type:complete